MGALIAGACVCQNLKSSPTIAIVLMLDSNSTCRDFEDSYFKNLSTEYQVFF